MSGKKWKLMPLAIPLLLKTGPIVFAVAWHPPHQEWPNMTTSAAAASAAFTSLLL